MEGLTREEYDAHRKKCSDTFDNFKKGQDELRLAMFGDNKGNKGVYLMTKEMHDIFYSTSIGFKLIKYGIVGLAFIAGLVLTIIKIIQGIKA